MEIWKPINSFPNYEISSEGRIRNSKGEIKILQKNKGKHKEYYRVRLYNNTNKQKFYVHRLVAEHFYPNQWYPECYVMHLNGDGLDNRKENLKVGTQSENMQQWWDEGI